MFENWTFVELSAHFNNNKAQYLKILKNCPFKMYLNLNFRRFFLMKREENISKMSIFVFENRTNNYQNYTS